MRCGWLGGYLLLWLLLLLDEPAPAYRVQVTKAPPPAELSAAVRALLAPQAVQLRDAKGQLLAEVWLSKEVSTQAAEALKRGVTYRDLPETALLGVIRFPKTWSDYRKQKVKAGTYTLRLGFQPQDGDHMGTAPYTEFALLVAAAQDSQPAPLEAKKLYELSASSIGTSHPAVFLLVPVAKAPETPQVARPAPNQVALQLRLTVRTPQGAAPLGLGLTLIGHAD